MKFPTFFKLGAILVPRGRAPFGQHQESPPPAGLHVLSMRMRSVRVYGQEVRKSQTSGVEPAQRSRFLVLTKTSAESGDENDLEPGVRPKLAHA